MGPDLDRNKVDTERQQFKQRRNSSKTARYDPISKVRPNNKVSGLSPAAEEVTRSSDTEIRNNSDSDLSEHNDEEFAEQYREENERRKAEKEQVERTDNEVQKL